MSWCRRLFSPRRDLITFTFSGFLTLLASAPASAQFYVRSPAVDKGEAEIEEHGAFYSGPGEDERLRQSHEIEGKYGITERFEGILEGELEQPIGEDLEGKAIEQASTKSSSVTTTDWASHSVRSMNLRCRMTQQTKFCLGRWRNLSEAVILQRSTPSS